MDSNNLNILNFNASRTCSLVKINKFLEFLNEYDPIFVCIQEINVVGALKVFSSKFQVLIKEASATDGIGIVTLVKKGFPILDSIIGKNGRIIGAKVKDI